MTPPPHDWTRTYWTLFCIHAALVVILWPMTWHSLEEMHKFSERMDAEPPHVLCYYYSEKMTVGLPAGSIFITLAVAYARHRPFAVVVSAAAILISTFYLTFGIFASTWVVFDVMNILAS